MQASTLIPVLIGPSIGLIIGSFATVCLTRRGAARDRKNRCSVCDHCGKQLAWHDNIPVLSFILLRGQSRCCNLRINWWYPLVEVFFGIIGALLYHKFPFLTAGPSSFLSYDWQQLFRFSHSLVLVLGVFLATWIDIREMIIPDTLTLGLMGSSPLVAWLHPDLSLPSSLMGLALGFGSFYLLSWTYYLLRRQVGLGAGDVKYFAGLGGWLGVESLMPIVLVSSLTGLLFGIVLLVLQRKDGLKTAFPFGPFLGLGALVFLFGGSWQEWILILRNLR